MRSKWVIFALFFGLFWGDNFAQVVLSEIMFNPIGTERNNEFVEIYNTSLLDTINLTGWRVGDGTKFSEILAQSGPLLIKPHQFAVILSPNYFANSDIYDTLIPPEVLLLSISSSQFGAYGLANDRSETVTLYDSNLVVQSQWQYSVTNPDGISEEKRVLQKGDFDFNWGNSMVIGGTPGFVNSVTPLDYDLAIDTTFFKVAPSLPSQNDSLTISFWLKNVGTRLQNNCRIELVLESPDSSQLLIQDLLQFPELQWLDSTWIILNVSPLPIGVHRMSLSILSDNDENEQNNNFQFSILVNPSPGDILLTELYLLPGKDGSKWIEIQNLSGVDIDLSNWSIKINNKSKKISQKEINLELNERLILSESLEIEELFWKTNSRIIEMDFPNGTEQPDYINLQNENNVVIDSVIILPTELLSGVSLERMENGPNQQSHVWGVCPHPQGATLGEANAYGRDYSDLGFCLDSIKVTEDQTIAGQNIRFSVCIFNPGTTVLNSYTIELYNFENDSLFQTLSFNEQLFPLEIRFVQFELYVERSNQYTFYLKMIIENDAYLNNNEFSFDVFVGFNKNAVIINEIMYNTDERDEEWIEIFNPGDFGINLKNWTIGDAKKAIVIAEEDLWMSPSSFVILGHKEILSPGQTIEINLPEYNNSTDQVVLKDFAGNIIDSLKYQNSWGGERLVSLERIRFEGPSTLAENWAACIDSSGHTAGTQNSVSPKSYDISINTESVILFPSFPTQGEDLEISVKVDNNGRKKLADGNCRLFVKRSFSSEEYFLADSVQIGGINPDMSKDVSLMWRNITGGIYTIFLVAENALDLAYYNNTMEFEITIGYPQGTVLINEIMYNPAPEQDDWVEVYNNGSGPVELANWRFSNSDTSNFIILSDSSLMIGPKQFFVFSKDTMLSLELSPDMTKEIKNLPNLKVAGDDVFIYDGIGGIIDHLQYYADWGELKGRSLERINPSVSSNEPSNWAQNVTGKGHTAGEENSIYTRVVPSSVALEISPDPFSPDGDGFDDLAAINITLPTTYANINIKIFDMVGRMVRFLANNEFSGSSRTIFWDGKNDDGRDCRIGIYIVYLQALDESKKAIIEEKKTIVLAKPL